MLRLILFLLFVLPGMASSQGMWVPIHLEKQHEKTMKSLGLKISADDIYSINDPSIKDAICQFGGGCTGEMISPEGLLLTNHHCGVGAIQRLSSLEKNYVDNGYWAMNRSEELPATGITATFVVRIEDVTPLVMLGMQEGMNEIDRQMLVDKNISQIKANTKKAAWEEVQVRPFYNGNQYFLFVTQTFRDVRFVGAPPGSIGKFGNDTDNWVWPRHTGDFSLFRVYADSNNQPADYAPTNVPYKPRHFLPISVKGAEEGDFTMVYGFPGRTDEYLPALAVDQIANQTDPAKIQVRETALKILDGYMRRDPAIKIAYIARYASISNYWKKWLGESQGLNRYKAVDKKRDFETEFNRRVNENAGWKFRYGNILPRLEEIYREIAPLNLARDYYNEVFFVNSEIFSFAATLAPAIVAYETKGENAFNQPFKDGYKRLSNQYKNFKPDVDQSITAALLELFADRVRGDWGGMAVKTAASEHGGFYEFARWMYENSVLANPAKMAELAEKPASEIYQTIKKDPAYDLFSQVNNAFGQQIQPKLRDLQAQINMLQRQYMAAQLTVFKDRQFFPDANSTLRVTYGKVAPYTPRDAVVYQTHTYLDGVMEKYLPGDYEFDVPQKLRDLYAKKDFGSYTDKTGRVPVAFIATNHTTGGNSGSPALDGKGNLIGLNFDRVWEGTMSDLYFEPAICRNIMMDTRYLLFIIDKYAGASHLLKEMKIVK